MAKRTLKDLNLLDDFLFGSVVMYPEIGEAFVREILTTIFGKPFGNLTVIPQKTYYGSDTEFHGTRLDVYLEETVEVNDAYGNATVYDIEPDQNDRSDDKRALPKRMRFYHAKIDAGSLKSGENYQNLKNVMVILITPYDPFDKDHMVYTVRNKCEEIPDLMYDDGACTVYLYTKGKKGNPRKELRQLLRYMEHTTKENACNESLKNIQQMVETVKRDGKLGLEYMKIFEREEMLLRKGRKEGFEEGRKEERINTERERKRADAAEAELERLKEEVKRLQQMTEN